jgi:adenylate cyclase
MTPKVDRALIQKERELHLVLELDHVRDSFEDEDDPQLMFDTVVKLLKQQFDADACAIMLVAETSDDIESVSALGMSEKTAIELCHAAMKLDAPGTLTTKRWPHTLGIRIILNEYPLGGVVLARVDKPFDEIETTLLATAESQIDSAIIQARLIWKLLQRNRELEAIYQIDRLRDHTSHENDLTSGFTSILLEHFKAELCMVLLTQIDSGELTIRGMVDKFDLSTDALDVIRNKVREIKIPQVIDSPPDAEELSLLAAPFIVSGVRLGAIVVGRKKTFTIGDHRLLHAMISQMDSAMVYSRIFQQLGQRNKELEIIYRIDRIRDREQDFDVLLQSVLRELCDAVSSEMGYIMLYSETEDKQLELRSSTVDGLMESPEYSEVLHRFSREALDTAKIVYSSEPQGAVRSITAIPLILKDQIIGVFGAVNSTNPQGFSAEDRRVLTAITSQVDTAVFEKLEQRRMRKVLGRSVDPKVLDHLLQRADANVLQGERVTLSVLFADIRGSTEWTERIPPDELVSSINTFLGHMTDVIFKHGGTLDKFVGDEVIGLFGTPLEMDDHAYRAARAALEMQVVHKQLQAELAAEGRELPSIGVGISSGEVIAGEFGPPIRAEFTAMGRSVNLGSRLCSAAEANQVLISQATYEMIQDVATVNPIKPLALKGIKNPAPVYELVSIYGD